MIFVTQIPRPPLDAHIDWFWYHEGLQVPHSRERVLPDGSTELIINLRDSVYHVFDRDNLEVEQAYRRSWISGAHSTFIVIDTATDGCMAGVHFKPGGASRFLGRPASELQNTVVDLDALWNSRATGLRERLLAAPTPEAKFAALEESLLALWRRGRTTHPSVGYALRRFMAEPHANTIGEITSQLGLSRRRFVQVFTDEVGLTPKLFCRVRRFQRVLDEIERRGKIAWTDVALTCGYYDQAHFINDFREFCGMNPTEFIHELPEHRNFVPLRE